MNNPITPSVRVHPSRANMQSNRVPLQRHDNADESGNASPSDTPNSAPAEANNPPPAGPSAIASPPPTAHNPAPGNNNNGNGHRVSIPNWVNTVPTPGGGMRDNGAEKAIADVERLFP